LDKASFGLAAAWGDYDNDGDLDLYLTNYGPNLLYRNNGDGTFTDVTAQARVGDSGFSAGCGWGDYDNDGDIDLYVATYVKFKYRAEDAAIISQQYGSEIPYTINPSSYPPASNRLYRNNGDGTFAEVAEAAGVLAADYRGAMGMAVGDYEHDGDFDLFVTHWIAQENAFFENRIVGGFSDEQGKPRLFFTDEADMLGGLGQISLNMVGWATGFADFDNDSNPDLWIVNGHTLEMADDNTLLQPQRMHLFHHEPGRGFIEVGQQAAPVLAKPVVGRGGAQADYDGDGKIDIAVMVHSGVPLLLHNTSTGDGHWLALRLRQSGGNTYALGARVTVRTGELVQTAQVGAEGSYLSQHHSDRHFGLGPATQIDELTIYWPDGAVEKHQDIESDRLLTFKHVADYRH